MDKVGELMAKITRPALRYFGGKWRLAPWIISHFPEHVCYVEPFGGAMSVLLNKKPALFDVYNDLDRDVVAFFRCLRDRPEELLNAIRLTPFSRAELKDAYQPCSDEMEQARRIFVRAYQSIGGPRTQRDGGWRFQVTDSRGKRSIDDFCELDHLLLVAERLKSIYIECDEACSIIRRYDAPTTLFYADPPYVAETRTKRWSGFAYMHEMTDEQHVELAKVLQDIQGMAIISGYPSESYDRAYAGWLRLTKQTRTNTVRNGGKLATEVLWISPRASEAAAQGKLELR